MEAKTYRVKSISEAIDKIREELGPEASVLHTRRINQGIWSWLSGHRYEVVASGDLVVPDRFQQWLQESIDQTEELVQQGLSSSEERDLRDSDGRSVSSHRMAPLVAKQSESFEEFLGLSTDVESWGSPDTLVDAQEAGPLSKHRQGPANRVSKPVSDTWQWDPAANDFQHGWDQLYAWIKSCDADSLVAKEMCQDLRRLYALTVQESPYTVVCPELDELVTLVGGQLKLGGTIQAKQGGCQRVALVGPTGVGKTTTLAKLAGEYQLRRGWSVGMITVDTYRVGAVDQLSAYAQIMKIPIRVVSDANEMREAIAEMADLDLVLVDTVGRSPSDASKIQGLHDILRAANLDQTFLTLSASSSASALQRALDAYQYLSSGTNSGLIITKVDECLSLASLYPLLRQCPLHWAYWTNGQDVPDDLGVARENVGVWFLDQIRSPA